MLRVLQDTFKVKARSRDYILKSAGVKWRQFKTSLTRKYVLPFVGQKKKLNRPPKEYEFVGKSAWKKFVAQRIDPNWKVYKCDFIIYIFFYYEFCTLIIYILEFKTDCDDY